MQYWIYRFITTSTWTAVGHFSRALSKGVTVTSWIWNLHVNPHEYESNTTSLALYLRKVFSSNMSHGTLVLTWLSSMHFHGAYFSNYSIWIKSPAVIIPSSQSIWNTVGQDILNSDVGAFYQGLYLTSGLFNVWRSSGLVHYFQLKLIAITLQTAVTLLLLAAYLLNLRAPTYII